MNKTRKGDLLLEQQFIKEYGNADSSDDKSNNNNKTKI